MWSDYVCGTCKKPIKDNIYCCMQRAEDGSFYQSLLFTSKQPINFITTTIEIPTGYEVACEGISNEGTPELPTGESLS